jgi:hypothetical protein
MMFFMRPSAFGFWGVSTRRLGYLSFESDAAHLCLQLVGPAYERG